MDALDSGTVLRISVLHRARFARFAAAAGVVACWMGLILADLLLSVMFFSDPNPKVALYTSPMLLAVPWILLMAGAHGTVLVRHDALVIRHRRVLRRPLTIPRTQVRRILLDDGAATGRARFATGDPREPLLWTDQVVRRQHADRPLIGDGLLPNLAIVLDPPLPMDAARDPLTAVPVPGEVDPPPRRGRARALLLAMEDLEAARLALAGWPVERPDLEAVVPREVSAAAARVPQDAAMLIVLASVGAFLLAFHLYLLVPVWAVVAFVYVQAMVKRRQEAGAAARADLERRAAAMSPADRATALAAIDANLGTAKSQGPPGW